ncbi:MAG: polyamine aminopropyltransferase [Thaumarchaeota archaeon]|jgi:spermidine synthase|nr:polyamine aminopropyltransferase [Candidatus Wolframiiraptor allenii]
MMIRITSTKFVLEWITESLASLYGIEEVIYSGKTRYQRVDILRTRDFGLVLLLDGFLQSSEEDEFIYHELLVHPAMIAHPKPRRVLIVGGGEGATAREVERHADVEEIQMVDLDGELIEIVKRYLPWGRKGFEDPRLRLVIEEGREYLSKQPDGYYDVIIMDVTDPSEESLAIQLYTKEFYELAFRKLGNQGIIITHAAPLLVKDMIITSIQKTMASVFPRTCIYASYVKSLEGMWSFIVGSKGALPSDLRGHEVNRRLEERGVKGLKFYSGEAHDAIFTLTKIYLRNVKADGVIYSDGMFSKEPRLDGTKP